MGSWKDEVADLVEHRGGALRGYAYVLCGNAHDAEDLFQEALVKVFSRLRSRGAPRAGARVEVAVDRSDVDPGDVEGGAVGAAAGSGRAPVRNAEGYVRSAMLSLYLDGYRRRARWLRVRHLTVTDERPVGATAGAISGAVVRADVVAALAGLSPRQRACVVLRFYDDLTVPEVARTLGLAEGTVKRHLHDAMGALRGVLGPVAPADATDGADGATDRRTDDRTDDGTAAGTRVAGGPSSAEGQVRRGTPGVGAARIATAGGAR